MKSRSERDSNVAENPKAKPDLDDQEQSQRFLEMAELLGTEEMAASFEAAISAISTAQKTKPDQSLKDLAPSPPNKTKSKSEKHLFR